MSSDLEILTIEQLAAPIKNAIVGGPFGSNLVSKDYVAKGVPVIRGQNMGEKWVGGEFVYVSEEKAIALAPNKARPGDLVFTQRGTLGQVSIVPAGPFPEYIVSQSQMKLTPDPAKVDVNFLYYCFRSPEQQDYIQNSAIQTGVPHTNLGILKKTPIAIPPLVVQRQIAGVLKSLDDRITLLRETNQTLESIAQVLFKSWFVDFDPVRAKSEGRTPEGMDEATATLFPDGFEMSELGEIPRGWRVGDLGEIGKISNKKSHPGEFRSEIKYVGLEHMPRKSLSLREWDSSEGLESSKAVFQQGSILFGKLRPYFHKVVIAPFDGVCSTDILVCQSKDPGNSGILSLHLFSDELINFADRLSNGAKMPRVSWADVASYKIVIPPIDVSTVFSKLIQPLFDAILGNVHRSKTLQELRDSLLPRLISGQLRLPEAEAEIEELTA